jgi:hypothetical protein
MEVFAMKKFVMALTLAMLALPMMVAAQSPLDGTWKFSLNEVNFSPKPDVYVLAKGMYSCNTCTPAYTIKADGTDQAVSGHPYYDTVAMTVVNDRQVKEVDKKGGKVVAKSTMTVSGDGKTVTFDFSDASNTNGGAPVVGKGSETRVAAGPAGSHAVSGSWKMAKIANLSENAIVFSYQVNGNELTMKAQTGQWYTAKLDGSEAPMKGDPGVSTVQVKMLAKNVLEETDKRNGKVISTSKTTVSADGKTAKVVNTDLLSNRTSTFLIVKQ